MPSDEENEDEANLTPTPLPLLLSVLFFSGALLWRKLVVGLPKLPFNGDEEEADVDVVGALSLSIPCWWQREESGFEREKKETVYSERVG